MRVYFSRSISPGTRSRRACRRAVGWQGQERRRRRTLPRRRDRWKALGSSQDTHQDTLAHAAHPRPRQGSAGSPHCAGRSPPVRTGTHAQVSARWQYDEGIPDELW